jgi:hypothetical protein
MPGPDDTTSPTGTPAESGTPTPADIVAGIVASPATPPEPGTPAVWNHAEGVPGQGDRPEWFQDRYATISDQAKAYKDLETKFGSFTGAPEAGYEINLSEDVKAAGIEINKEDPLYDEAIKFATERHMNQDGFNEMMNLYATAKIADQAAIEQHKTDEIASLGAEGQARVNNLISWGRANLSEELFKGFEQMPESAGAIKALEHIISLTQAAPITPENLNGVGGGISDAELNAMQFERDEHGNRRLQTDPAFAAEFREKMKQRHGSQDHNIIVGT